MPKQKKSKSQLETKSRQRNVNFLIEKDKKRDAEGSMARQVALEKLGIQEEFGFKDHDGIYSYADYSAPIKMIDASLAPPAVTEYPAYPRSEFSTPPAFNVAVDRNKKQPKTRSSLPQPLGILRVFAVPRKLWLQTILPFRCRCAFEFAN